MKYKPLGSRYLIAPLDNDKTAGGLYLPTDAQKDIHRGKIVEVGTDNTHNLEIGDVVYYHRSTFQQFENGLVLVGAANLITVEVQYNQQKLPF